MLFADIPCILSDYRVVDQNGCELHGFRRWYSHDDVPPDVGFRRIISIKAQNNEVIVEVE